jgi:putative inorganic carbon (HCO3(-)) transporter
MRKAAETIVNWEWLILILLMPLFWFPESWRSAILLLIPIFWLLRKAVTGRFFPATPDDVSILFLLAALLASLGAVFDIQLSFPKITGLIVGIALFYAAVQHARVVPNGSYHIVSALFLTGTSLAVAGFLLPMENPPPGFLSPVLKSLPLTWANLPQIGAFTVNANELAGVLCWIVPLLCMITISSWSMQSETRSAWDGLIKWALLAMLLINSLILLATNSRGGILSVFIAFLVMIAIQYRWGKSLLLTVIITISVLLIVVGFVDVGVDSQSRILAFDETGLVGRVEIWSRALYALREFPLTGVSMNGFRELVPVFYPMISRSPDADVGHAHNHLLQAGLDLGIPGLIAYLSVWFISAGLLWLSWRNSTVRSDRALILGLSGSLTAGWLFGLLDAISLGAKPGFLWWLLIGLLVAAGDKVAKNKKVEDSY